MKSTSNQMFPPREWLSNLSDRLQSTQARIDGQNVSLDEGLEKIIEVFISLRARNGALWWVGNGGSNGLCQHLSQDVLNKLKIRSLSFAETPLITCMANDFGYKEVYSRPLTTLAQPGDALIAISSSGKSENILNCVELAHQKNMSLITLSGFNSDNPLWNKKSDVSFYISSNLYGLVEVGHEAILHSAIESLWLRETQSK
ncbi:MAG: SIS domain-containing protein [Deltaproteobacteria bacterium]|nr:SIS domain-containing protein [Deltaproteobacteria bacterium]